MEQKIERKIAALKHNTTEAAAMVAELETSIRSARQLLDEVAEPAVEYDADRHAQSLREADTALDLAASVGEKLLAEKWGHPSIANYVYDALREAIERTLHEPGSVEDEIDAMDDTVRAAVIKRAIVVAEMQIALDDELSKLS